MPTFEFPSRNILSTGTGLTDVAITLSQNGDYAAMVFVAEAAITAKKIAYRTGAVTVSSKTIEYSIQTVGADGLPTGTTVVSGTTTTTPLSNAWVEFTFTGTGSLSKGTLYAVVIKASDATWVTGTGSLPVLAQVSGIEAGVVPYSVAKQAGGAASAVSNRNMETFYIVDNAGSPKVYGWPFDTDTTTVAIGINPDEAGMQFLIPATVCSTYRVAGIKVAMNMTLNALAPNIGIAIYNWNSGNYQAPLDTNSFANRAQALSGAAIGQYEYYFDNPPTLTAGNEYVVSLYTTDPAFTTATLTTVRGAEISDTVKPAMWDNTNDYEWNYVSRALTTDNWTTTANRVLAISLIIDILSLPSGGSTAANPLVGYVR
jgi:hypothetical protein